MSDYVLITLMFLAALTVPIVFFAVVLLQQNGRMIIDQSWL